MPRSQEECSTIDQQRSSVSTVGKTFTRRGSGRGSNLPFAIPFFFQLRACAVREQSNRTSDVISLEPWYHMSYDAYIYNLQFDSGVFQCSKHGLDSSLEEPSPGQLGPHGSWGFSPVGGNRLHSEGELVKVLSRKGKEDCRNS